MKSNVILALLHAHFNNKAEISHCLVERVGIEGNRNAEGKIKWFVGLILIAKSLQVLDGSN